MCDSAGTFEQEATERDLTLCFLGYLLLDLEAPTVSRPWLRFLSVCLSAFRLHSERSDEVGRHCIIGASRTGEFLTDGSWIRTLHRNAICAWGFALRFLFHKSRPGGR